MAETTDSSAKDNLHGRTPEVQNNAQASAQNSAQAGADDLAKLADAATSEGSSINSEDYWFLKLNGNC